MRICSVVGTRPNFAKTAPVLRELTARGVPHFVVHTGQHYDPALSQSLLDELGMARPEVDLGVGSDSHARQTASMMVAFEQVCLDRRPDVVLVAGDTNSALAAALVAAKLNIPVAHLEAGLRSGDRTMPEEVNRVVIDALAEVLFTTEPSARENLLREGVPEGRIHFVGNCMIDTLLAHLPGARARAPWRAFGLEPGAYALATLHRPANVDRAPTLARLVTALNALARRMPVVFPVHPRTRARLPDCGVALAPAVIPAGPLPYTAFVGLMSAARCVVTDSGGVQDETTALRVPCLTVRDTTERPVTVTRGTSRLVGADPGAIEQACDAVLAGRWPAGESVALWDGRASARVADALVAWRASRESTA